MITINRTEELMDEHENAAHGAHFEEAKWQSAIDGDADASESKCALNQTHKVRLCVKLPTGQKNTHRARCTTVNITDEARPIINMSCMVVAANTAESSLSAHIFFPLSQQTKELLAFGCSFAGGGQQKKTCSDCSSVQ